MYRHVCLILILVLSLLVIGCNQKPQQPFTTPPAIDFTASPKEGTIPLTVDFTSLPTGEVTQSHWDFGDGQFSNEAHPVHSYTSAGKYTTSLAVMGPGGSDVETKVNYIEVTSKAISWEDAGHYIKQKTMVEGIVVDTYYGQNLKGKPTFLDFHKPYQGYFKCVIWGTDRDKFIKAFSLSPEIYFLNKRVQVTGMIIEYPQNSGDPEMILTNPSQIVVVDK